MYPWAAAEPRSLRPREICPHLQVVNQTVCLPKSANQRVGETGDIVFSGKRLARQRHPYLNFAVAIGLQQRRAEPEMAVG
jgi:hypothetical protein